MKNEELKLLYNQQLRRYYNGCRYIQEHYKETEKWLPEIMNIVETLNLLLEEIQIDEQVTNEQILEGF